MQGLPNRRSCWSATAPHFPQNQHFKSAGRGVDAAPGKERRVVSFYRGVIRPHVALPLAPQERKQHRVHFQQEGFPYCRALATLTTEPNEMVKM